MRYMVHNYFLPFYGVSLHFLDGVFLFPLLGLLLPFYDDDDDLLTIGSKVLIRKTDAITCPFMFPCIF